MIKQNYNVRDFNLLGCYTYSLKYIYNKSDFIHSNGIFHYPKTIKYHKKYKLLYSTIKKY